MLPLTFLLALIASASAASIPSDNFNDVVAFSSDSDIGGLPQIDERSGEWPAPETGRDGESWSESASSLDGIEGFASPDISRVESRLTPYEQLMQEAEKKEVKKWKEAGADWPLNFQIIQKIGEERSKLGNSPLHADVLLAAMSTTRAKLLAKNNCKFVSDINLRPSWAQNYYRAGSSGPLNQQALIDKWSKSKLKSIRDESLRTIGCGTATGKNCRLTICTMSR
ncbi:hypothetical protein HDU67_006223 [Dinochytrium kinnereticum]|nr:hypothetical protein HDU67_006223 [Dinochytrium kinnereticum]